MHQGSPIGPSARISQDSRFQQSRMMLRISWVASTEPSEPPSACLSVSLLANIPRNVSFTRCFYCVLSTASGLLQGGCKVGATQPGHCLDSLHFDMVLHKSQFDLDRCRGRHPLFFFLSFFFSFFSFPSPSPPGTRVPPCHNVGFSLDLLDERLKGKALGKGAHIRLGDVPRVLQLRLCRKEQRGTKRAK